MRDSALPITHIVTAAEAAYPTLVCHISELHKGGEWLNAVIPVYYEPWPLWLTALYAEVSRAGVPVKGIPVALYAQYAPVGALNLTNNAQGYLGRGNWFGRLYTPHGFGLILRLGAVAAGDLIVMGAIYDAI
jgi:hypothetical protein